MDDVYPVWRSPSSQATSLSSSPPVLGLHERDRQATGMAGARAGPSRAHHLAPKVSVPRVRDGVRRAPPQKVLPRAHELSSYACKTALEEISGLRVTG